MWKPETCPLEEKAATIQLPYINSFGCMRQYQNAFDSGKIDFASVIGPVCPICGKAQCYREISPYKRSAIDLFPSFRKQSISIARFLCRKRQKTFSLLPIQLIPYMQYSASAVIGTLILGLKHWEQGEKGFWGAFIEADPESLLSPWLVFGWLKMVGAALRRCHRSLCRWYELESISTVAGRWQEIKGYFHAFGWAERRSDLNAHICRYSRATRNFLFGNPSQRREAGASP